MLFLRPMTRPMILGLGAATFAPFFAVSMQAQAQEAKPESRFFLEYLDYEERVYSKARKTELGEKTDLDLALRYQYSADTFARFRIDTDPVENPSDSKTSKLELLAFHRFGPLELQADADVNMNDGDSGGISIGPDQDSEGTFIAYRPIEQLGFIFYPYNFDGEVGREFNTWDVTRLHYVDGAPNTINDVPLREESIRTKTIPGIEISWSPTKSFNVYAGVGTASYLYPSNEDFSIDSNVGADRWEWRQDTGVKGGFSYLSEVFNVRVKHARHDKSEETGSLLAYATSVVADTKLDSLFFSAEYAHSKAGKKPYRLSRETKWFEETTPFQPIYSDYFGERQDWLGKSDSAWMVLGGVEIGAIAPYLALKYQGEHFIYREPESAHTLRVADGTASHGGLRIYTLGLSYKVGNFVLRPEAEWMQAKNRVFGSSGDVREDPILANYRKNDFLLTFYLTYQGV